MLIFGGRDLRDNNLNGSIPDLSNMVYLESLALNGNNLTGTFPSSLAKLPHLKYAGKKKDIGGSIILTCINFFHSF